MFKRLLFAAMASAGTEELKVLLAGFKEHNSEADYNDLVGSLQHSFNLLARQAEKTQTKVDDSLVGIVLNALPKHDH